LMQDLSSNSILHEFVSCTTNKSLSLSLSFRQPPFVRTMNDLWSWYCKNSDANTIWENGDFGECTEEAY
jgi:hypothetical protein